MKKSICFALLCMIALSVFSGIMMTTVTADENHNDISNEYSEGPREPPDHGMQREESRTSFKDAQPSDFKNQQFKLYFSPFLFSVSSDLQFPQRTEAQVIQAIRSQDKPKPAAKVFVNLTYKP